MAQPEGRKRKIIAQNRKARHDYEIITTYEAGIVLQGTEVKSLREGKCNLQDSYAVFPKNDASALSLIGLHISPYNHGNRENHLPMRERRLLLHEKELFRLRQAMQEKGLTLVPLSIYFSGQFIKVEIATARGKKLYDKRQSEKEKDSKRELARFTK
jgi:SsrA-binding protein